MKLLPAEYLPDDYKGPNAGTEKQLIGNNKVCLFAENHCIKRMQRSFTNT